MIIFHKQALPHHIPSYKLNIRIQERRMNIYWLISKHNMNSNNNNSHNNNINNNYNKTNST